MLQSEFKDVPDNPLPGIGSSKFVSALMIVESQGQQIASMLIVISSRLTYGFVLVFNLEKHDAGSVL